MCFQNGGVRLSLLSLSLSLSRYLSLSPLSLWHTASRAPTRRQMEASGRDRHLTILRRGMGQRTGKEGARGTARRENVLVRVSVVVMVDFSLVRGIANVGRGGGEGVGMQQLKRGREKGGVQKRMLLEGRA